MAKCVQVLKTDSVYDMIKPSGAFCLLGELMCVCLCVSLSTCVRVCTYICACVCVFLCLHAACVCTYVCMVSSVHTYM